MKTLVFDVDNCIADVGNPALEYKYRLPFPFVKEKIDKLKSLGYNIVFQTARYMERCYGNQTMAHEAGYLELKDWLEKYKIPYDRIYFGKPSGVMYIDDRGFHLDSSLGESQWDSLFNHLANNQSQ